MSLDRVSVPMEEPRSGPAEYKTNGTPKRMIQRVYRMAYAATRLDEVHGSPWLQRAEDSYRGGHAARRAFQAKEVLASSLPRTPTGRCLVSNRSSPKPKRGKHFVSLRID